MDKLAAIKAALCIIATIVSTSGFASQLWPNVDNKSAGGLQLSRSELSDMPLHATALGTPDDFDPRPHGVLPTDRVESEGKAPRSKIKLEITLTMRRQRMAGGKHSAHRSCR